MSEENTDYLIYEPAPPVPEGFDEKLRRIVGVCPNQVDTYIRFVWGMDRMEQFGEKLLPRYPDPDDKYVGLPFWVLEGWQSPDVFDKAEWEANKHILGEFPRNGVWDFIEVHRTKDYRFLPLGTHSLKLADNWKFWKSKPKKRAVSDLLEQRQKIAELKEKRWEAKKAEICSEFVEDYQKAYDAGDKAPEFSKNLMTGFKTTESGILIPANR